MNIFLVGPMAAGKSTIGRLIAKKLALKFYDSDTEIERRTGVDVSWIFDQEGETGFRQREAQVIDDLTAKTNVVVATGGGSVLTAANREHLRQRGVVIYLQVSPERQLSRTDKDTKRPLLQGKTRAEKAELLQALFTIRDPLYRAIASLIYETDAFQPKQMAEQIALDVVHLPHS